jgi:exosome complex component RRP46
MAAVYGPMAANPRQEKIERATIEVTFAPLSGSTDPAETHKSFLIRQCVETIVLTHLHPRAKISVIVQVLREDGSLVAAALNCVCLALIDAGVQCGSMLSAVCLAVSKQGAILLDPTAREEEDALCVVTTAFRSTDQQLVLSEFSGTPLDEARWPEISRLGKAGGETVIRFFRSLLSR